MKVRLLSAVAAAALGFSVLLTGTAGAAPQGPGAYPIVTFKGATATVGGLLSDTGPQPSFAATWTWTQFGSNGICSESGRIYKSGVGWTNISLALGQTSYAFATGTGTFQEIEVTVGDCSPTPFVATYYDYNYPSLAQEGAATYGPGWTTSNCLCWSSGAIEKSTKVGTQANYQFSGYSVALISDKAPVRGTAKIFLDGVLQTTISTKNATKVNRVVVFSMGGLSGGQHVLTVQIVSGRTDIDAFLTM